MVKQFSRLLLIIVSVISISACNSEKDKLRYELVSSIPVECKISYTDSKCQQVNENFNGTQWTYEGEIEFVNSKQGHSFRLSCEALGSSPYTVTLKLYRGQNILDEVTVNNREPMPSSPTLYRASAFVKTFMEH